MKPLERALATMLRVGVRAACVVMAIGVALTFANVTFARGAISGARVVSTGIALLIALPVLRVAAMFVAFLRARDRRAALVAAAVLLILFAAFLLGITTSHAAT